MDIELSKYTDSFDTRFNRWAEKSEFWNSLSDAEQQQFYQEMKASTNVACPPEGFCYNHTLVCSEALPKLADVYNHILNVYCLLAGIILAICTAAELTIVLCPIGIVFAMGFVACLVPVLKQGGRR